MPKKTVYKLIARIIYTEPVIGGIKYVVFEAKKNNAYCSQRSVNYLCD
jgi:hypothetical protein